MKILKLILSKIYFFGKRYNSFFGNNSSREFFQSIALIFTPNFFLKGKTKEFEKKFGIFAHTKFNYSYALGRMALYQGIKASSLQKGDEILLPAFTCVVVPNAIIYAGLTPIYVDIESTYFNFNLQDLEKKITTKTKALYLQYTFGHVGEIQKYYDFALKHNLIIIEDCAHTLDQKVCLNNKETPLGTIGLFAFYSTDHSKIISTYLGGMLCTNNIELSKRIEELNSKTASMPPMTERRILINGIIEFIFLNPYMFWIGELTMALLHRMGFIFHFNNELVVDYGHLENYPMKLGSKLSTIGLSQLNIVKENLHRRLNGTSFLNSVIPLKDKTELRPLLRYSFLVKNREAFCKQLEHKFQLGIWFTSIFQGRENHFEELLYKEGSCPNAEYIAKHIVNFPTHLGMDFQVIKNELEKISFEVI